MSTARVVFAPGSAQSLTKSLTKWATRGRRTVLVSVQIAGHEQDSFAVSSVETLRRAIRPVYAHLPGENAAVRLIGVEEEWLPLGVKRRSRMVELPGVEAAGQFLAGSSLPS